MTAAAPSAPEHTVVHQLADRMRCRAPRVRADESYACRVLAVAEHDERVAEVRVNRSAASVTIRWAEPLPGPEQSSAHMEAMLRDAEHASMSPSPPPISGLEDRGRRLALPATIAGVAGLGRLLGFALPGPVGAAAVLVASLPIARRALHSVTVERRLNI